MELVNHIDVNLYLVNPSPEYYWVDEKSPAQLSRMSTKLREKFLEGNELLMELGKVQKDTFKILFENEEMLNAVENTGLQEPEADTLLGLIQNEIYHSIPNEQRQDLTDDLLTDGSLTIQSNYTESREVETLYNYLVDLVDKNPGQVNESDILVLITDVNKYAPYIRAVFDNAPYKFHYHIADTRYASGDTYLAAIKKLLDISEENFTAENVLDLLSSSFIRNRAGITDVDSIRQIVEAAGIRYGFDNKKENETYLVSWSYGIKKIMYGLVIKGSPLIVDFGEKFFAVDEVEGMAMDNIISFISFVEELIKNIRSRKIKRSIADWNKFLQETADMFVNDPLQDDSEEAQIFNNLLATVSESAEFINDQFYYRIIAYSLSGSIEASTKNQNLIRRGIKFCSFIPCLLYTSPSPRD